MATELTSRAGWKTSTAASLGTLIDTLTCFDCPGSRRKSLTENVAHSLTTVTASESYLNSPLSCDLAAMESLILCGISEALLIMTSLVPELPGSITNQSLLFLLRFALLPVPPCRTCRDIPNSESAANTWSEECIMLTVTSITRASFRMIDLFLKRM